MFKHFSAISNGVRADIKTEIKFRSIKISVITITTAEFDNPINIKIIDQIIQKICFEERFFTVRAFVA